MKKWIGIGMTAAALAAVLAAAQAQTKPAAMKAELVPMGTSSTGSASFAWFYETSSRTAVVCQTGTPGQPPTCARSAALP